MFEFKVVVCFFFPLEKSSLNNWRIFQSVSEGHVKLNSTTSQQRQPLITVIQSTGNWVGQGQKVLEPSQGSTGRESFDSLQHGISRN